MKPDDAGGAGRSQNLRQPDSGIRGLGFKGFGGLRVLGFRGLGLRVSGFRGLGCGILGVSGLRV